jgi:hypothetical protein
MRGKNQLLPVHARLFAADVAELKRIAEARGIGWQVELRLLVRHALASQRITILDEPKRTRGK